MSVVRATRRRFLGAAAGLFATAPLLRPSRVLAQEDARRLVVFIIPNGVRQGDWFSGDINALGQFLNPLAPYAQQMTVMQGLTNKAARLSSAPDHIPDFNSILTGRPPVSVGTDKWSPKGPSIDHAIGSWLMNQPDAPSVDCLRFGARPGWSAFCYGETGSSIRPESDPYRMFDRHFSALGADEAQLAAIRAQKKSVIDLVLADVQSARCASGAEEKEVLDVHLQRVREAEQQLQSLGDSSCQPPQIADSMDPKADQQMIDIGLAQQKMLALSLACGITRVATMQHADGRFPAHFEGNSDPWHNTSHDGSVSDQVRQAVDYANMRWPAKQFRALLDELSSHTQADGTMLDHTMVLWVHEQGNTRTHDRGNHCALVAGGTKAGLKGGQAIDFGGRQTGSVGEPTSKLLVTAAQFMGMNVNGFGDDRIEKGPLDALLA